MARTEGEVRGWESPTYARAPQHDRSPEEIRQSIQGVRTRMDRALDELEHRLAPRHVAERTWRGIRNRLEEHPVPFSLIGAGLAWLAYERFSSDSGSVRYGVYGYRTGPSGLYTQSGGYRGDPEIGEESGRAESAGQRAVDTVREKMGEAREAVRERTSEMGAESRERAGELTEKMSRGTARAGQRIEGRIQENPLVAGLALFGVGLAAAMMLPSTRREDRWMGEARERVTERAKGYGHQVTRDARDVAGSAMEAARETAKEKTREKKGEKTSESTKSEIAEGMSASSPESGGEGKPKSRGEAGSTDRPGRGEGGA